MKVKIYNNKFNFNLNQLVEIGKRSNNSKRNFLFVSKLLGKHLVVKPDMCKAAGHLLASTKYPLLYSASIVKYIKGEDINISQELNKTIEPANKVLVIGFAETATGLGMAVASKIKGCIYQTTTREPVLNMKNMLQFEEEHSHATTHKCFTYLDYNLDEFDEIILVDDEITTGNSMINLIDELTKICNVKHFSILSILDWRNKEQIDKYKDFCTKKEITIHVHSILSGEIEIDNTDVYIDDNEPMQITETKEEIDTVSDFAKMELETEFGNQKYLKHTGRFGVKHHHIENIETHAKDFASSINSYFANDAKILVLGHGENIYIPSRIASYMNANVDFKTTTRSPIYCDGELIKTKHTFEDRGVTYYLYNKEEIETYYDRVILFTETPLNIKLTDNVIIINI